MVHESWKTDILKSMLNYALNKGGGAMAMESIRKHLDVDRDLFYRAADDLESEGLIEFDSPPLTEIVRNETRILNVKAHITEEGLAYCKERGIQV